MTPVPFVIGQWVRGERFYGRQRLIAEILDGPRNGLWLLGTRDRVARWSSLLPPAVLLPFRHVRPPTSVLATSGSVPGSVSLADCGKRGQRTTGRPSAICWLSFPTPRRRWTIAPR